MGVDKGYLSELRRVKQLVKDALAKSAATGVEELAQKDGSLGVQIRSTTKDFYFYTRGREGTELTLTGLSVPGMVDNTIRAVRSIARTFNAKVKADFNGTPMTAYPRSTAREVDLDWSYRRVLHQHPEINP